MRYEYSVTHQVVKNLQLTSKQKFRFGLARPKQHLFRHALKCVIYPQEIVDLQSISPYFWTDPKTIQFHESSLAQRRELRHRSRRRAVFALIMSKLGALDDISNFRPYWKQWHRIQWHWLQLHRFQWYQLQWHQLQWNSNMLTVTLF